MFVELKIVTKELSKEFSKGRTEMTHACSRKILLGPKGLGWLAQAS